MRLECMCHMRRPCISLIRLGLECQTLQFIVSYCLRLSFARSVMSSITYCRVTSLHCNFVIRPLNSLRIFIGNHSSSLIVKQQYKASKQYAQTYVAHIDIVLFQRNSQEEASIFQLSISAKVDLLNVKHINRSSMDQL